MTEIMTFEQLFEIQDEKYRRACSLDLVLIRGSEHLVDGYALLIGADCSTQLELFFLSKSTYLSFTEGEKDYLHTYYGID